MDSLHFDFIGSFIDYDSLLTSSGNHFVQEESDGFPVLKQIGNLYYTGNVVWVWWMPDETRDDQRRGSSWTWARTRRRARGSAVRSARPPLQMR